MTEVTQDAYIVLRTFITSNWRTVSLRNDSNVEVKQLPYDETKVKWTHTKTFVEIELSPLCNPPILKNYE